MFITGSDDGKNERQVQDKRETRLKALFVSVSAHADLTRSRSFRTFRRPDPPDLGAAPGMIHEKVQLSRFSRPSAPARV